MAQLFLNFRRVGHRAGDFLAEQFVVAVSQTVHGFLDRLSGHAQFRRHLGVSFAARASHEEHAQPLEPLDLVILAKLLFETREHLVQQCQCPSALEEPVGAAIIHRFQAITLLGRLRIE